MKQLLLKTIFSNWSLTTLATVILISSPATSMETSGDKPRFIILDRIVTVSRSRDIATEFDGRIASVHFVEGQIFRKRDLVIEFDPTLKLPDESYYSHPGKAIVLGFDLNPKTKMGSALAVFPNPDRILKPGLQVAVEIHEK